MDDVTRCDWRRADGDRCARRVGHEGDHLHAPPDCLPRDNGETVVEVHSGEDSFGRSMFFAYWIAEPPGGEYRPDRVRGQVFHASLAEYADRQQQSRRVRFVWRVPERTISAAA